MDDYILNQLKMAYKRGQLINIFRVDGVLYTGYLCLLNMARRELVMRTYDEWGMANGMVYLKTNEVADVELGGKNDTDLLQITRRIQVANAHQFKEIATGQSFKLNKLNNLRVEILARCYVEGQMVLVTRYNVDVMQYEQHYEGLVKAIDDYYVTILTINKNDFTKHELVKVPIAKIFTIEFLGIKLTMLTNNQATLFGPSCETQSIDGNDAALDDVFDISKQTHQLLEVESAAKNDYYYVGYVVNYDQNFVILNLVNMNGQFGGYVLLRRSMVKTVFTQSDYLHLINKFVEQTKATQTFLQPVLNDEREFDMSDDVLLALLQQAITLKRIIRIAVPNQEGEVGYPLAVTPLTSLLTFKPCSVMHNSFIEPIDLPIQEIGEVAFDYLEAFFYDDAYKNLYRK